MRQKGHWASEFNENQFRAILEGLFNMIRITETYVPAQFDGDVIMFLSRSSETISPLESSSGEIITPLDVWKRTISGELKVFKLDCEHGEMLDSGPASEVAAALTAELERQFGRPPVASAANGYIQNE